MAQALEISDDTNLILGIVADKLNENTRGSNKQGLISVAILYSVIGSTLISTRAESTRECFKQFLAIVQNVTATERFDAYWMFGLHGKFGFVGVESSNDHWIRVKAVDGVFTPATLWADLGAACASQMRGPMSRRGVDSTVEGRSNAQVSLCFMAKLPSFCGHLCTGIYL